MNKFDLIRKYCEVIAETSAPYFGIYYKDSGIGYAEFDTPSGIAEYSCDSIEQFHELCDCIADDDGESIDDMDDLEMGFDPYEGCYTFDC